MASHLPPQRHLDASAGREVVYCHACQFEWYREETETLDCPRCHGEITEIVTADTDPRNIEPEREPRDLGSFPGPGLFDDHREYDSDPEEADIEQHVHRSPNTLFMQRTLRTPMGAPRDGSPQPGGLANHGESELAVLRRFTDMFLEFHGGAAGGPGGRPGPETLFPHPPGGEPGLPGGHRIQRTTVRPGPLGGHATITIATFGDHPSPGNFDAVFGNLMNRAPPPGVNLDPHGPGDGQERQGQMPLPVFGFANGLQEIIATLLNPGVAVRGDAVYTQEALDRIITQLMEASPQANGPPPASEEAISKLQKRNLVIADLGSDGKAECTICIDELHVSDEVTVLPCKHWFHGDCVTLWLKEHNTCPICRTPIEAGNNSRPNGAQQQHQQQQQQPDQGQAQQQPNEGQRSPRLTHTWIHAPRNDRPFRSQRENEERLNAIRNLAGDRSSTPRATTSSFMQGPPAQRRSSHSPPPDPSPRIRDRSPSSRLRDLRDNMHPQWEQLSHQPPMSGHDGDWSHRQSQSERSSESGRDRDRDGERQHGHGGPFGWLRDQFSRHSSSGSGSGDRDRRRP